MFDRFAMRATTTLMRASGPTLAVLLRLSAGIYSKARRHFTVVSGTPCYLSVRHMQTPFEPTNSFCYQFSRYTVLPEIIALPEVQTGKQFSLVEMVKKVVDRHLALEQ